MDPRCFFGIACKIDLTSGVSKPAFDSNYTIPKLFFRMDADSIGIIGTARYFFSFFFFWISLLGFSRFMMFIVSFAREKNNRARPHCSFLFVVEVLDLSRDGYKSKRLGKKLENFCNSSWSEFFV